MRVVNLTLNQTDDKMLKRYMGTIVKYSKINNRFDKRLFNEQLLNYYQAKEEYNPNKGTKFNTFLTTFLVGRRSNFIRDNSQEEEQCFNDEVLKQFPDSIDIEKSFIEGELAYIIDNEIDNLDTKSRYIVKKRIFNESTFQEIADYFNCSKQSIHELYHRRIKELRETLKKKYCL